MFEGFTSERIAIDGGEVALRRGGSGEPLLLLHGYPQTHAMWHRVAPRLAERFSVVCPDLRGYGDSFKPPGGGDHSSYSFRAMAGDQVEVMNALGFDRFGVVGHDRGARVAHRMALDHPDAVTRLAVLDIVPTYTAFASVDKDFAQHTYHWFFLSQPFDLPERLIGTDPGYFLGWTLASWTARDDVFTPEAMSEYRRCFLDPETIHATCEDYRASASINLEHDAEDLDRRLECPLLVLWGEAGRVGKTFDPLGVWRERATDVSGRALPGGHFPAEESPEDTTSELFAFLGGSPV